MTDEIEIYIDRIVLEGFDHLNKVELNEVIREHLSALVIEKGINSELLNSNYHRKLNAGEINLPNNPEPGQIGNDIAKSIFSGINTVK